MYKHLTKREVMYNNEAKIIKKFTSAKVDPAEIYNEAVKSTHKAVDEYVAKHGEPMYCGFANVLVRPAQGPFVAWLKANDIGDNGYAGGYRIPWHEISKGHKNSYTQSMDIKETGCDAFADVLEKYGLSAYMQSRAD
jgi:hypothetical protein